MLVRRACSVVLACAVAVAALAGCSNGHGPPSRSAPNAYVLYVTTAGRVHWQLPLPLPALGSGKLSRPAVGAVAAFAEDDVLYGLRLADGHQAWSRALSSEDMAEMWRWQDLVIVLTIGAGGWPVLAGLNVSTGQARWTRQIAAVVDGSYPTADGGLVIFRGDHTLEVVDMSSGRVRWTSPAGYPPGSGQSPTPVAVADGAVVFAASNGKLTSCDDRTGQIRWADALMPVRVAADLGVLGLQAAAGLVYATGARLLLVGGRWTSVLLGVSAADGHVMWQFAASPPEALWNYAPGLVSVTSGSGGTWQDELDPATGRVRWRVASSYEGTVTAVGVVTGPGPDGTDQISVHDTLTGQTRWIARLAGLNVGWKQRAPALPVFPAGPLLVVPAAGPAGSHLLAAFRMSDGHRAWQVTIPAPIAAPPQVVPGGMLVYAATIKYGL